MRSAHRKVTLIIRAGTFKNISTKFQTCRICFRRYTQLYAILPCIKNQKLKQVLNEDVLSSEILRRVECYKFIDVSQEITASIITAL
jgi:ribosomal protein S14